MSPDILFAIVLVDVCPMGIGSTGAYWATAIGATENDTRKAARYEA
jgi:hypothetical protein